MKGIYKDLKINEVELDMSNPRIAKYIEMYDKDSLTSEALALALGSGVEDSGQTNYNSLFNSIRTNKGIIHPILVNHQEDGKYVVIEGNTRLKIYQEFKENGVDGDWDTIPSIVYEKLTPEEIHAIRLQSHLVGPREWDPYSKAKYLYNLCFVESLPMNQIIDFCGGKTTEIMKFIHAYQDMEKYYRPQLEAGDEFDQREFSKFFELQNTSVKEAVLAKFTLNDYAKWVIDGIVDTAINVRKLPQILKDDEATKVLLKSNIKEAYEKTITNKPEYKDLNTVSLEQLCVELTNRIYNMQLKDYKDIKDGNNELGAALTNLKSTVDWFVEDINKD